MSLHRRECLYIGTLSDTECKVISDLASERLRLRVEGGAGGGFIACRITAVSSRVVVCMRSPLPGGFWWNGTRNKVDMFTNGAMD